MLFDAPRTLLLIGADPALRRLAAIVGTREGWRIEALPDVASASTVLQKAAQPNTALLSGWSLGSDSLEKLLASRADLPVIVTGAGSAAFDAIRAGASDFLATPVTPDRLVAALREAGDRRRRRGELRPVTEKASPPLAFDEIVGSTPAFRAALAVAAKAARSRLPVLIEGERGTGKETVALAIHRAGPRAGRPLVGIDCGAAFPNLIESALFGHEKGAFAGAFDRQPGRLEQADGGTLFIDDVAALPVEAQDRLLHFIKTGELRRIGARGFKPIDVRIIAGAGAPLLRQVAEGRFREDLCRHLCAVHVQIPPLRERRGDIPDLARHMLARISQQPGMRPLGIRDDALEVLMAYGWPGNVRQLQSALLRAALACQGNALTAADLPRVAQEASFSNRSDDYQAEPLGGASAAAALAHAPGITLYRPDGNLRSLDEIEADVIRLAIGHYQGRMTEVARRLGIGRSTLYRKLAELGISDAA
ncbi:MAG TPA: sigma-54 dependent transcriptional regulator [Allosphingosinicella sp.]|nr:sigma-54 dependent transcriptional regulator [Allosphingosinicella sp.]